MLECRGFLLWYLYRVCTRTRCEHKRCLLSYPECNVGRLVKSSLAIYLTSVICCHGVQRGLSTMSALFCNKQNGASFHLLHFLPESSVVIHFSLISSRQRTPLSCFCLPFLQEVSLTRVIFFHFMTWLFAPLLLCEGVSCAHSRSLPSFSHCPYINTGCDLNIHVSNMFLQLH